MANETLFGEASSALQGATQGATGQDEIAQRDRATTLEAGSKAASNLSAERQQTMSGEQAQKLAQLKSQLDQAENMVTVTPQIALGLVKNTGVKEWLQMAGPGPDGKPQKMRADMLLGLYTHGMNLNQAKKAPKITQIYDENGKVRHAVVYTDEDGNIQQLPLDAGITPEKLHPKAPGKGGANDPDFKKNQQFIKSFENAQKALSDPAKVAELKGTDPDKLSEQQQWIKDNQDRYDQLIKQMGAAGGEGSTGGASSTTSEGTPDNAPFDADAFIKEALGNQ